MVQLRPLVLCLAASAVHAAPLHRRIAQTISASTARWEQACLAAGGADRCNPISVAAFSTLLAAAGPCEQQNAADKMIDLAKTLQNNADMIRLTQIFTQQPRNTPSSQSVPYCQQAPKNAELHGLFQCQFAGASPAIFVGGVQVGQPGTIPFGLTAPIKPAGSCPAHPDGPIADGTQLVDIVQTPGSGNSPSASTPPQPSPTPPPGPSNTPNTTTPGSPTYNSPPPPPPSSPTQGNGFRLENGKNAQALNAKFLNLTPTSACTSGEEACIGGNFAQCVSGNFVVNACPATLKCLALPLVNKPGTSLACTTEADALDRITATGATGGLTGSDNNENPPSSPAPTPSGPPQPMTPSTSGGAIPPSGNFRLQNGKDAQTLNSKFATLTADSPCNEGENACLGTGFAQCVGGKFVVTACGSGLTCAALPLVNKPGTSIACTTPDDAAGRIAATGATGGITGA